MDEEPRFRFFSLTFLVGFGVGTFIGVALGLMAFLFVDSATDDDNGQARSEATPVFTTVPRVAPTAVRARTTTALEVRIGPGTEYAAVGTIARGEAVDVLGRDSQAEWVAIQFPPGSTARGWVPVNAIQNLSGLYALDVTFPTPLPRSVATPRPTTSAGGQGGGISGNDGIVSTPVVAASTPVVRATPTPAPAGQPDLAVTGVSRLADGSVRVSVTNRGTGDLQGFQIFAVVTDPTTRSETLRSNGAGLRAGDSTTLQSTTFVVLEPTTVTAIVDPSASIPDANRNNNALTVDLGPPAPPTPTPEP